MRRNSQGGNGPGRLRIIGGQWRRRVLPVQDQPGLRPTPDRVRETLFNWLQHHIPGARCLDLFAGSGALGLEAASRGAAQVVMVECAREACQQLKQNIAMLDAQQTVRLVEANAMDWLAHCNEIYDIVFLDPPYASGLLPEACQLLEQQGCFSEPAYIYLELASNQTLPELPEHWRVIRDKKAGQVSYYLVIRETGN